MPKAADTTACKTKSKHSESDHKKKADQYNDPKHNYLKYWDGREYWVRLPSGPLADAGHPFCAPWYRAWTRTVYTADAMALLSEAAEFLAGALWSVPTGLCIPCAADMLRCTREEALKATKELILNGLALGQLGDCSQCQKRELVTQLRQREMPLARERG